MVPSIAGPKRPQDRVILAHAKQGFNRGAARLRRRATHEVTGYDEAVAESFPASDAPAHAGAQRLGRAARLRRDASGDAGPPVQAHPVTLADGTSFTLDHGAVTIAAITSCTNTSNPSVMIGAALVAKKAVEARPHPQAVGEDLAGARLEGGHRLLREGRASPST